MTAKSERLMSSGNQPTTNSARTPVAITLLGLSWFSIGMLSSFLGFFMLHHALQLVNKRGYEDLLAIILPIISLIIGVSIIIIFAGYHFLKARLWAKKTVLVISSLSIILGFLITPGMQVPALGNWISIFGMFLTYTLFKLPIVAILPTATKISYVAASIASFILLSRKNLRKYFETHLEPKRNGILVLGLAISAVGVGLAALGYGYATGTLFVNVRDENSMFEGEGEWSLGADIPLARDEARAAAVGSKIYVVGGLTERFEAIKQMSVYDTTNGEWSEGVEPPIALDHAATVSYHGKLYVIGGFKADRTPSDTLFIFDPVTERWTLGDQMPTPRGALTAQFIDGMLYAVGGFNHISLKVNEAYDPESNSWTHKASMLTARDHLASGVIGGKLYVIGGRQGDELNNVSANEEYDPKQDKWISKEPMPTSRGAVTAASLSNSIFVFCGASLTTVFSTNEQYIPSLDKWIVREPVPTARHGCASAEVEGSIYVIGGSPSNGLSEFLTSHKNEVFTLVD